MYGTLKTENDYLRALASYPSMREVKRLNHTPKSPKFLCVVEVNKHTKMVCFKHKDKTGLVYDPTRNLWYIIRYRTDYYNLT